MSKRPFVRPKPGLVWRKNWHAESRKKPFRSSAASRASGRGLPGARQGAKAHALKPRGLACCPNRRLRGVLKGGAVIPAEHGKRHAVFP